MKKTLEKFFSTMRSRERTPSLRVVQVKANSIGEAMEKVRGGAGQAELDWALANPKEARRMLKEGDLFFFPGATDGVRVSYVYCREGGVWQCSAPRDFRWRSDARVVLCD